MSSTPDKKIRAVFSDYDGTLCSAMAARDSSLGQNRIPRELKTVLEQISHQIPICIISSKDFSFLEESVSFARVISCIMGIETLSFARAAGESEPTHRTLTARESELSINSKALEGFAATVESSPELAGVVVERKRTFEKAVLAGVTVDWRKAREWDSSKEGVRRIVFAELTKLSGQPRLFLQEYASHPFLDLYAVKCDKGKAFDVVFSELARQDQDRLRADSVMYLGDSENDNPAFDKAGIAIGVRSDSRLKPRLQCQHSIEFNMLAKFLGRLKDNQFQFRESLLG